MAMTRPDLIDLTEVKPALYVDLTINNSDSSDIGDVHQTKNDLVNQPTPSTSATTPTTTTRGDKNGKDIDIEPAAAPAPDSNPSPAQFNTPTSRRRASLSPAMHRQLNSSRASRRPVSSCGSTNPTPQQQPQTHTPRSNRVGEWTVARIADELRRLTRSLDHQHRIMAYRILQASKRVATRQCPTEGPDLFSDMTMEPVAEERGVTVKARFKLASTNTRKTSSSAGKRTFNFRVTPVKTDMESVPSYRFHHVEIRKSVLTPQTRLKYAPHVRDLEESEESEYNQWLQELAAMEEQSGFKPQSRERRVASTFHDEAAARLAAILPSWLTTLSIEGVSKSTLIRYMATQEQDSTITPQQKSSILDSQGEQAGSPLAVRAAKMFTDAFDSVFNHGDLRERAVPLRDILFRDETVDTIVDSKRLTKDAPVPHKPAEELDVGNYLETHTILACLICFSNSCDHGEFDNKNQKHTFSLEASGGLKDALERRSQRITQHHATAEEQMEYAKPCGNQCFREVGEDLFVTRSSPKQWTDRELRVLRALVTTAQTGPHFRDPSCNVAGWLETPCWEVRQKIRELDLSPTPNPKGASTTAPVKNLPWYDRYRKLLLGDWQDRAVIYEHQRRELSDPCSHDGPCTPANGCPCAEAGVLCERFCRCTVDSCNRKFTGCACHSMGKVCYSKQKERPCICVQLNRECDPALCGSCGARDRADPENVHDDELHETGCQNCALQRGNAKAVVLGKSQLDGCGYGLWAAEDIAQDDFVIEYVGELITHDEGVRREARRGDVFNEEANSSYLFTLLDNEGIWVDAAVYGNLSRYINHASESDKKGCNITPKILYVNGEYRIRFSAMRDIRAGEELFFNYGENFPNLTKKLLEDNKKGDEETAARDKIQRKPGGRRGRRRREDGRPGAGTGAATTGGSRRKPSGRARGRERARSRVPETEPPDDVPDDIWAPGAVRSVSPRPRKRKRVVEEEGEDQEEEEEYNPEVADSQGVSESVEGSPGRAQRHSGRRKRARRSSPRWDDAEEGDMDVDTPTKRAMLRLRGGGPRRQRYQGMSSESDEAEEEMETPVRRRRGRPKKQVILLDDDDDDDDDSDGYQGRARRRSKSRSERKTQRPARYRDESL